MSTTSVFSPVTGQLTIFGDSANNGVVISRDKSGRILINNGQVKTIGGDPTVANTNEIDIFGQGGDDTITVNESNGPMPAVHIYEVRPRKDRRGFDLISDQLPFGRLWSQPLTCCAGHI